jgi:hypothetical protein
MQPRKANNFSWMVRFAVASSGHRTNFTVYYMSFHLFASTDGSNFSMRE